MKTWQDIPPTYEASICSKKIQSTHEPAPWKRAHGLVFNRIPRDQKYSFCGHLRPGSTDVGMKGHHTIKFARDDELNTMSSDKVSVPRVRRRET